MFVLGPARLKGAVQMLINPIAIRLKTRAFLPPGHRALGLQEPRTARIQNVTIWRTTLPSASLSKAELMSSRRMWPLISRSIGKRPVSCSAT